MMETVPPVCTSISITWFIMPGCKAENPLVEITVTGNHSRFRQISPIVSQVPRGETRNSTLASRYGALSSKSTLNVR